MTRSRYIKFWLPPVIYTLVIVLASSLPQRIVVEYTFKLSDKLLHTGHYMLYGFTLIWAFLGPRELPGAFKRAYLKAIGVGALVGILDEFYQSFIPSRTSSGWDALADTVGIVIAGVVFYCLMKIPKLEKIRRHA